MGTRSSSLSLVAAGLVLASGCGKTSTSSTHVDDSGADTTCTRVAQQNDPREANDRRVRIVNAAGNPVFGVPIHVLSTGDEPALFSNLVGVVYLPVGSDEVSLESDATECQLVDSALHLGENSGTAPTAEVFGTGCLVTADVGATFDPSPFDVGGLASLGFSVWTHTSEEEARARLDDLSEDHERTCFLDVAGQPAHEVEYIEENDLGGMVTTTPYLAYRVLVGVDVLFLSFALIDETKDAVDRVRASVRNLSVEDLDDLLAMSRRE